MRKTVGKNAEKETCPLCYEEMSLARLWQHLKERHGIDPIGKPVRTSANLPEYGEAYEWGDKFNERGRNIIPKDQAEEAEPHHGEIDRTAVDGDGNPVNITPQRRVADEMRRGLRGHGAKPEYILLRGPKAVNQYTASPIPIWAVAVIIAVAIIAVIGAVYFAGTKLYDILVSPFPDWMEPYVSAAVTGGILIGGGYLTYKVVS